ncbi:BTB/POZ domain-containing protein axundead [Musca autumnalis]|uniref:BTB/POZ domain-containing protein axundead n=1 Tax=Musca autumnalis TaxID=221902 RepID=UPI003CE99BF3
MVLPFGLGSDGHHNPDNSTDGKNKAGSSNSGAGGDSSSNAAANNSNRTVAYAPTAPPYFMRAHTNVSTGVPIIPCPYIDFIIVNGDDRYMIRCERKAVLENSVELAKLIHAGPNSGRKGDNHFQISNVDKHDFELVIRFLETKFVKYRDHLHILKILELADRYNCPDLIIHCIRELDLQLSSATVIDVFRALWFYQGVTPSNPHQIGSVITTQELASKKSKRKAHQQAVMNSTSANPNTVPSTNSAQIPAPNPNPFTTEDYGVALLHNALQLIDMHAELILSKPEMSELRFEELEMIAKREALQLSSELTLFTCLADWSIAECNRKKMDATAENRRRVLGPLCLTPRYCLMTSAEFRRACDRVELLNPVETSLVSDAIEGKKLKNLTPEQSQLLEKFRTNRPEFAKMPIHLSDRSNPKNYPKKMRRAEKGATEEGCWENFGLNCLAVFACIFD